MPQKVEIEGSLPGKFILLCEDDPDDQEMLKDIFSSIDNSFILFFVSDGKEVLSALEKFHDKQLPCLIVLDYNMPGMTGADILREMSSNQRYMNIPKVVWSTSGSAHFRDTCLKLGAKEYIIKPNSHKDLEKIARYMLSVCNVPVNS